MKYGAWTLGPLPVVSFVVPFWGYLIGSLLYIWLNQKRNYNGDYRYSIWSMCHPTMCAGRLEVGMAAYGKPVGRYMRREGPCILSLLVCMYVCMYKAHSDLCFVSGCPCWGVFGVSWFWVVVPFLGSLECACLAPSLPWPLTAL